MFRCFIIFHGIHDCCYSHQLVWLIFRIELLRHQYTLLQITVRKLIFSSFAFFLSFCFSLFLFIWTKQRKTFLFETFLYTVSLLAVTDSVMVAGNAVIVTNFFTLTQSFFLKRFFCLSPPNSTAFLFLKTYLCWKNRNLYTFPQNIFILECTYISRRYSRKYRLHRFISDNCGSQEFAWIKYLHPIMKDPMVWYIIGGIFRCCLLSDQYDSLWDRLGKAVLALAATWIYIFLPKMTRYNRLLKRRKRRSLSSSYWIKPRRCWYAPTVIHSISLGSKYVRCKRRIF